MTSWQAHSSTGNNRRPNNGLYRDTREGLPTSAVRSRACRLPEEPFCRYAMMRTFFNATSPSSIVPAKLVLGRTL